MSNLATITSNILADSGIDDINVIVSTGSYANPAWITSLAWTKITGAPSFQLLSEKAQPNGYASLDGNGKVPLTQINDALIGNVNYQGLWNAATNTPTLVNPPSSGTKGYYYIVSTAGTFAGISFEVGDWIISNGSAWQKVDNTDAVSSVFGRTGNVIAANGDYNTSQVTENTNLYFTQARVSANTDVAANTAARHNAVTLGTANGLSLSTQQLSLQLATSGQNGALSSTDWTTFNNKENAITAGTTAQYFRGDKTFQTLNTAAVPESGNLYFTNARAIASVLTGYTSGAGTISAADSILSAIQKLNGNIGALVTGVSSVNGQTGAVTLTTSNIAEGTNLYFTQARVSANTDVAANTAARHNAVTLGTANGLSLSTQQLSLGLASAGVTGALSGTDWSTFNSKQNALTLTTTGTSGAATLVGSTLNIPQYQAAGNYVTAVTASSPLASSGGTTPNITIQQASGSQNGFLSSTDWTTFNNKQNALTNPVTGTGTAGQVAYWSSASSITGESNLFWDATNDRLGIGTASPSTILQANFSNSSSYSSGVTGNGLMLHNTSTTNNQYVGLYFLGEPAAGNAGQATIYGITTGSGAMDMSFSTRGSSVLAERMRITSGGNVLIGQTLDLDYKLLVSGTGFFSSTLLVAAGNNGGRLRVGNITNTYAIAFEKWNSSLTLGGFFQNSGSSGEMILNDTNGSQNVLISSSANSYWNVSGARFSIGTTVNTTDLFRVNGNTFTNTLMTWNPENDNRSGVEWRFGAASIASITPNRRLRVSVNGIEYYIGAVEV